MKKITFLFLSCFIMNLSAQVTGEGEPVSWSQTHLKQVTPVVLETVDMERAHQEDAERDKMQGVAWRFGIEIDADYGLDNAGVWDELSNGDRIWRMNIVSEGAKSMNFIFDEYYMPPGGMLYFYNDERTDLLGAYNNSLNRDDLKLGTWTINGDKIWIEYYEPKSQKGKGKLNLSKAVHGYRFAGNRGLNDSGPCHYDVDCSIGGDFDNIKEQLKRSVAHMIMGGWVCSGGLINNVNNDKTPYFLTANHCEIGNSATWAFRFNWISPDPVCGTGEDSPQGNLSHQTSGATIMAANYNSDFMLLHIDGELSPTWNLVWAGWNRSATDIPEFTVGIHHPAGDIMKVSRDYDAPTKTPVNVGGIPVPVQSWRIGNWELGATAGGSSGSPLFDQYGRIVGQLSGGSSECVGSNNNGLSDYYGRMDINWDFGGFPGLQLSNWLDPDGTGAMTTDMLSTQDFQYIYNIAIYPNPASSYIYIMNNNSSSLAYELFNVQGQRIKAAAIPNVNSVIDVNTLNEGIYFLKLFDGDSNNSITKRIIVKR